MPHVLSPGLAAAAAVAALGLTACAPKAAAPDPRLSTPLVAVATVADAGAGQGQYTGIVGARVQSDLGFRVGGKVLERLVDTGQAVKKGQPLMRIDAVDYAHALTAQTGNVAAAQARWLQADADERRNRGLVVTGAISQAAYDQVKAAADSAKALLDAAQAQEQVARDQAGYSVLVADADGTVVETLAEPGQVVAAGQLVVRLAHAGAREAIVNLPEAVRPAIGSAAQADLYNGTVKVSARLRQLSDAADPATRTFEARYVMDGEGASAPLGSTVTVGVGGAADADWLSVPLGAVDDEGRGPGVWIVDTGKTTVSFVPVQVHAIGAEVAEIRGPIAPGATLVATGGHYLHPGEKVRTTTIQALMQ